MAPGGCRGERVRGSGGNSNLPFSLFPFSLSFFLKGYLRAFLLTRALEGQPLRHLRPAADQRLPDSAGRDWAGSSPTGPAAWRAATAGRSARRKARFVLREQGDRLVEGIAECLVGERQRDVVRVAELGQQLVVLRLVDLAGGEQAVDLVAAQPAGQLGKLGVRAAQLRRECGIPGLDCSWRRPWGPLPARLPLPSARPPWLPRP